MIKAVSGSDSSFVDWACERGAKGIILEGSGAGNVPAGMLPGIERAIAREIPVVLTSRAMFGFLAATYGFGGAAGGGHDLVRLGVIPGHHLPSQKARITLMLALGAGMSHDDILALFAHPSTTTRPMSFGFHAAVPSGKSLQSHPIRVAGKAKADRCRCTSPFSRRMYWPRYT